MNQELLAKITELKESLLIEGFIIEGVFGSHTTGDNTELSDIDILYELNNDFRLKYKGFKAIAQLDKIQEIISAKLEIEADLVQKSTLNEISSKYILPEVVYV